MSPEEWYYRLDGRPHGPFTPVQFEKLIRSSTVTLDTEVSTDGQAWRTLREVLAEPGDAGGCAPTLIPGQVKLPRA
jgi:hypothetical protein